MNRLLKVAVIVACCLLLGTCGLGAALVVLNIVAINQEQQAQSPAPVEVAPPEARAGVENAPADDPPAEDAQADELGLEATEETYTAAKEELRSALDQRKANLAPDVIEPVEEDLGVIEGAVAEIGAALALDPDNEGLKKMLVQTYRLELRLLKKALRLDADGPDEGVGLE